MGTTSKIVKVLPTRVLYWLNIIIHSAVNLYDNPCRPGETHKASFHLIPTPIFFIEKRERRVRISRPLKGALRIYIANRIILHNRGYKFLAMVITNYTFYEQRFRLNLKTYIAQAEVLIIKIYNLIKSRIKMHFSRKLKFFAEISHFFLTSFSH